jgi:hypothetical protein
MATNDSPSTGRQAAKMYFQSIVSVPNAMNIMYVDIDVSMIDGFIRFLFTYIQ